MSRKTWKYLLWAVGAMFLLVLMAGGGFFFYRQNQTVQWRAMGDAAYQQGDWGQAQHWLGFYLQRNPDDVATLKNFADASLHILKNRASALQEAAIAYHQILRYESSNTEIQDAVLDLYERIGSWGDVEYYARDFGRNRPDDVTLRLRLARALNELGRGNESLDAYKELVAQGEADERTYLGYARVIRDRQDSARARAMLDDSVAKHPDSIGLRVARARFFGEERQFEQMKQELDEAVRLAPEEPSVLQAQAEYAVSQHDWRQACTLGEHIIQIDPKRAEAYLLLGSTYARLGETPKGITLLDGLDPAFRVDNPEIFLTLFDLRVSQGQFDEAEKIIGDYSEAYPSQKPISDYMRGRILLAKGQSGDASKMLATVVDLRPNFSPARFYLALAYLDAGQQSLGRSALETYIKMNPFDERARMLMMQGGRQSDEPGAVAAQATQLLEEGKASPEMLVATALRLFDASLGAGDPKSQLDTVKSLLNRAIELEPTSPIGYRSLTELLVSTREIEAARQTLDKAKAAGVSEQELATAVASMSLAQQNMDEAAAVCQKALSQEGATAKDYVTWNDLYARWGYPEEGIKILAKGATVLEGEERGRLEVAQVRAAARAGELEHALVLEKVATKAAQDANGLIQPLNEARETLAMRLIQEGSPERREQAIRLKEAMLAAAPESVEAKAIDGGLLITQEPPDLEGAKKQFSEVLQQNPDKASALIGLSLVENQRGDYGRAADYLEKALAADPSQQQLQLQLADLWIKSGRYIRAQEALRRILSMNPGDVQAAGLMVSSLLATGKLAEAEEMMGQLESGATGEAAQRLSALRSDVLLAKGAVGDAEPMLRQQYAANPDDLGLAKRLAAAQAGLGSADQGAKVLKDYAEAHPNDVDAWIEYARFEVNFQAPQGYSEAGMALTRALLEHPDYLPAVRAQIDLQMRQGEYLPALALCDRFLEKTPDDAEILFMKANLLSRDRASLDAALDTINRAIEQQDSTEYHYLRGMIQLSKGMYAEAMQDLEGVAKERKTTEANLDMALAKGYLELGRKDLAKVYFDSANTKAEAGQRVDPVLKEAVSKGM